MNNNERQPRRRTPLKPITFKIEGEVREILEKEAESHNRTLSFTVAELVATHPTIKKQLKQAA